jgi:hypothetical protein
MAGHLTVVSACSGGHLTNYFFKSLIPRGLPGGGGLVAVGFDSYIRTSEIDVLKETQEEKAKFLRVWLSFVKQSAIVQNSKKHFILGYFE